MEIDKSIKFLDLHIENIERKHVFKIHRKATQTSHTIHCTSHHPFQHKIAAYHHMLNRLHNVPMTADNHKEELNIIKFIANSNGYPSCMIDKIYLKIKNKNELLNLSTLQCSDNSTKKFVTIEYNKTTCNILKKNMKKFGYTVAFKTSNKIQQKLKMQCKKEPLESGVYKLICNDCCKFYIGQTGRTFAIRFKEHIDELNHTHINKIFKSNYAQHLAKEKHNYTDLHKNVLILHRLEKSNTLDRYEELEIYKQRHNPHLLNDKLNTKTNKIYDMVTSF